MSRAHAVTAAVASIALLSATLPLPAFTLSDFGPIVDGSRVPARIPAGVASFLVSWGIVTLACAAIWVWYLLRPGGARAKRLEHFVANVRDRDRSRYSN